MKIMNGPEAADFFYQFHDEVIKLVGIDDFKRYIRNLNAKSLNLLAVDESSFALIRQVKSDLHIDMVVGKAGMLDKLIKLKKAGRSLGFTRVIVQTHKPGMRRLHKRYGFTDVEYIDGQFTLSLDIS